MPAVSVHWQAVGIGGWSSSTWEQWLIMWGAAAGEQTGGAARKSEPGAESAKQHQRFSAWFRPAHSNSIERHQAHCGCIQNSQKIRERRAEVSYSAAAGTRALLLPADPTRSAAVAHSAMAPILSSGSISCRKCLTCSIWMVLDPSNPQSCCNWARPEGISDRKVESGPRPQTRNCTHEWTQTG